MTGACAARTRGTEVRFTFEHDRGPLPPPAEVTPASAWTFNDQTLGSTVGVPLPLPHVVREFESAMWGLGLLLLAGTAFADDAVAEIRSLARGPAT